jgi:hypothetical protein
MIIFDLRCASDHQFEGWFDDSEDFEYQLAQGQIACPYCNDINIHRVLSTVNLKKKSSFPLEWKTADKAWRELCRHVRDNFEDVGHNFAKEALKVHFGQAEERNIRGVTTEVEEDMLKREGVPFVKIPMPQELDS